MILLKKRKLFTFLRKKKETSVLKTPYDKFLNLLMRKGFKNRYINFFYQLLRAHKKRVKFLCHSKYGSFSLHSLPANKKLPTFPIIIGIVFRLITFKLELRLRKFKKSEILVPIPISPWRGLRLGLNLILKNSKIRIQKVKIPRKVNFLVRILDEIWDTFRSKSLTCKSILNFTTKVLESSENFRSTQLFPVNMERRKVFPDKNLKILKKKIDLNAFKQTLLDKKEESFSPVKKRRFGLTKSESRGGSKIFGKSSNKRVSLSKKRKFTFNFILSKFILGKNKKLIRRKIDLFNFLFEKDFFFNEEKELKDVSFGLSSPFSKKVSEIYMKKYNILTTRFYK